MLLRSSLLLAALASVAAKKARPKAMKPDKFSADSKLGNKLLTSARRLDNEDNRDVTWVADYSIKYKSCHTLTTVPDEEGGGGNEDSVLYNSNVVVFQLCPSSTCGADKDKCENGASYAISMREFVDAYTEFQMEWQEQYCENIRENCYCDNANDDEVCENQCYIDAGADFCVQYEDQEEFEVQRFLECDQMENNEMFFIGPYCANNGIYLGVFDDAGCVTHSEDGLYMFEKYNYQALPYSTESLVTDDCVSCMEVDNDNNNNNNNNNGNNNNNNNNQDEDRTNELCERMYEEAAKCESNLGNPSYSQYWYPNDEACSYIQDTLPRLDKVFQGGFVRNASDGGGPAKAFAWIFGISTVCLALLSYWLYTKVQRTSVNLSSQGGTTV